jgi:hypothetical protein
LRIQLATALRERDETRRECKGWTAENAALWARIRTLELDIAVHSATKARADAAESERDSLRTALTDIVTLCMDVPATEDWRAKVGDKARKALYGEAAWKTK